MVLLLLLLVDILRWMRARSAFKTSQNKVLWNEDKLAVSTMNEGGDGVVFKSRTLNMIPIVENLQKGYED